MGVRVRFFHLRINPLQCGLTFIEIGYPKIVVCRSRFCGAYGITAVIADDESDEDEVYEGEEIETVKYSTIEEAALAPKDLESTEDVQEAHEFFKRICADDVNWFDAWLYATKNGFVESGGKEHFGSYCYYGSNHAPLGPESEPSRRQ